MRNAIKNKTWIVLIFLICFMASFVQAEVKDVSQERILTGIILDEQGLPAIGVNVLVKGSTIGVATDMDGKFKIKIPKGDQIIIFSYIGYQTQEIPYKGQNFLNINLKPDSEILDVVVVVGYGVQKKVNLTGSVSSVGGNDIVNKSVGNVTSSLAGLIPGLKVMNRIGQPGSDGADLSIRGFGSPLILVDGLEQDFGYIDPNEIETISVLKDASATVYGARAGNGVILITTKRGKEGKAKLSLNFTGGLSAPTRITKMANSGLYAELYNDANITAGIAPTYSQEEIDMYYSGSNPRYPDTDWRKETLKNYSSKYDINLNARGGSEKTSYFLSVGYLNQKGLLRSEDIGFDRVSFRSNIDAQITKILRISADLSGRLEFRKEPGRNMNIILKSIQAARPIIPAHFPDESKATLPGYDADWANPLTISDSEYTGYNNTDFSSFRGTIGFNLDLGSWIKGLTFDGKFDYRLNHNFTKKFNTPFNYYDYDIDTDTYKVLSTFNSGKTSLREDYAKDWLWYSLFKLNYSRTFAKRHTVTGLVLIEAQSNKHDEFYAYREGFISNAIDELFAGSDENKDNGGSASEGGRMSYVAKIGYSFKDKYLFDAVARLDGSPKFAKGNRWGFFPAISVAWRINQEDFMKENFQNIDNLKLRLSVGQAGDEANVNFNYLTGYQFANKYIFSSAETISKGITTKGLANPDARWAETTTYNIGIDYSMFNRKIYTELDIFYRLKSKMLATRAQSLPSTFGATLPEENINKQDTRGFEIVLGHANKIGSFIYDIKTNLSWARSKWKHYDEVERNDPKQKARYNLTNQWTNLTWGYVADGLFSSQEEIDEWADITNGANNNVIKPGDIRYIDQNNDGIINWEDEVIIGKDVNPEIFFGLNGDFSYKNWSLNILFQGATNYSVLYSDQFINTFGRNMSPYEFWKDRWTEDNPNPHAKYPRVRLGEGHPNEYKSTFWVIKNAYYIRLKNIQLNYTIPKSWIQKTGINDLRLFVMGNNLLTLTNVRYRDPESIATAGWQYPIMKTFTVGINMNF